MGQTVQLGIWEDEMNIGLLAPGKESSEYKVVMVGLMISGCWILGLDVQPVIAIFLSKEAAELAGNITSAYPRGGWQAVVGMWGGISLYVWVRGKLKGKCPIAEAEK